MKYLFYICVCAVIVIVQSVILPLFPIFSGCHDLMIAFVVYLGMYQPKRESLIFILLIGFVMDSLSGTPFGMYITTYVWLFLAIGMLAKLLHMGNRMMLPFLMIVGVLVQNTIFIGVIAMLEQDFYFPMTAAGNVFLQMVWAGITGPFMLIFFKFAGEKWEKWSGQLLSERQRTGV